MGRIRFLHKDKQVEVPDQMVREIHPYDVDGTPVHDVVAREIFGYVQYCAVKNLEHIGDEVKASG